MIVFDYTHHIERVNVQKPEAPVAMAEYNIIGVGHRGQTDLLSGLLPYKKQTPHERGLWLIDKNVSITLIRHLLQRDL